MYWLAASCTAAEHGRHYSWKCCYLSSHSLQMRCCGQFLFFVLLFFWRFQFQPAVSCSSYSKQNWTPTNQMW